jgi:hypothetical protein
VYNRGKQPPSKTGRITKAYLLLQEPGNGVSLNQFQEFSYDDENNECDA